MAHFPEGMPSTKVSSALQLHTTAGFEEMINEPFSVEIQ
jgi:hypothetical protein